MTKHLVFVGGGHAHLTALLNLSDYIKRGYGVTLISPSSYHYYSGMGPGMLSGIYQPREVRFHVRKLVEDRGAAFIEQKVVAIEPTNRLLHLGSGDVVSYDVVSFNIGSEVPMGKVASPQENIVPVKPIINLYRARNSMLETNSATKLRCIVVGGGPAGVEISGNLWRLFRDRGRAGEIILISAGRLLSGFPEKARNLARASFARRNIGIMENRRVQALEKGEAHLSDGGTHPFDFVFVALGVKPSGLFQDSGLPTGEDGGLLVNECLQSVAHPEIFGGGDCISLAGHLVQRAGVHAVRQNPILHHNLMAALEGTPMSTYAPERDFLLILNMGNGRGIASKKNWVWNGRPAFLLKDWIDRRFMRKFQVSGELAEPPEA